MNTEAKFPAGKSVDVPAYLREHGNAAAAEEWEKMNEEHRDKFKTARKQEIRAHHRTADESLALMEKFTEGDEKWIPKDLEKGRCTPAPNPDCPIGSPQYNLAMTFKKHPEWGAKGSRKADEAVEELIRLAGFQPGQAIEEGWDPGQILYEAETDEDEESGGSMIPGLELNRGASDNKDLDEKEGMFEKGKPADPTKNMSPEDKKKWEEEKERHKDQFKSAADPDGDEKEGKFEKGKPADPTKNMSAEEAAEWNRQKEKNKDKFKKKALKKNQKVTVPSGTTDFQGKKVPSGSYTIFNVDSPGSDAVVTLGSLKKRGKHYSVPRAQVEKMTRKAAQVIRERLTWQKQGTINDYDTLSQIVDMEMESLEYSGEVGSREWSAVERAAGSWDSTVEKALLRWIKDPKNKAKFDMSGRILSRARRDSDIVDVLMDLRGGAGYLYFMEMEGHGVGTWDGSWDALFLDPRSTLKELSNYIKRALSSEYRKFKGTIEDAAYSAEGEENDEGRYASRTAARVPGGLYGFTKRIQADCERSARKVSKAARNLAKRAYAKDERVAPFLSLHGKRAKSLTARILTAAMKEIGPKVASDTQKQARLEELRVEMGTGKQAAADKEATHYGLYGYPGKTANLGITACATLREEAGRIAAGLHGRRANSHPHITGFLHAHGKQARCLYSRLLHRSYPEVGMKCASVIPKTVQDWISWED
jgi:hypothetical protein